MNQFAHYIFDEFPKIKVKFQNNIQNKEDYYLFEKEWLDCYNYKKPFIFVFDTTNVGMIHIKYVYKLTKFIHNLKKKKYNNPNEFDFLQYSIIIVNNWYIKHLLNITFMIQKPVAPVYIIEKNYDIEKLYYKLENKLLINDNEIIFISAA
jgi:hypothetical protein